MPIVVIALAKLSAPWPCSLCSLGVSGSRGAWAMCSAATKCFQGGDAGT